jgi:exodeoxyribonuclease V alpha subunit
MPQHLDVHKVFAEFFEPDSIKGFAYALSKKLEEGHTCIDPEIYRESLRLKDGTEENPFFNGMDDLKVESLLKNKWLTSDPNLPQPFVLHQGRLYIQRYFQYESEIIDQIARFIEQGKSSESKRREQLVTQMQFIESLFSNHVADSSLSPEEQIDWQRVAAVNSILKNFSIITGGPGTGKTTTVAKILALLYSLDQNLKVALTAPTGKAAARMQGSLLSARKELPDLSTKLRERFAEMNSSTIHRLLGGRKNSHYFKYNADNLLSYDVVIVDESSMIGASLMAKLLTAIKPTAKVLLLGDKDQLASVEAGSIFGDICLTQHGRMNMLTPDHADFVNKFISNSTSKLSSAFINEPSQGNILQGHITELKRSHRFKSTEGIGLFSKAVINGQYSDKLLVEPKTEKGEFVKVSQAYNSPELDDLIDHYEDYIHEKDIATALQKLNKVRILCAVRSGKFGVDQYNRWIEGRLEEKKLLKPKDSFYEYQPIMITRNDYSLDLFNGDVGIIRKDEDGTLKAWFEDGDEEEGVRGIHPGYLTAYDTVFAMTIHKSQGSEFTHVGIVLPDDDNIPLLTRELVYTGITRASKSAVLFTSAGVLKGSIGKQVERASGITGRLLISDKE